MRIVTVPCLKDNYAYLVICEQTGRAAVVDPSEAGPVVAAAEREGVQLAAIWNTHHHWDHTGGNKELLTRNPELEVVAHESDRGRVPGQSTFVADGDEVSLGAEVRARIIHNPGHTSGAVSYFIADAPAVFTGDTLFAGGCGRLFEGTAAQMQSSLARLAALPEQTDVYCGHEYTAKNLSFAAEVEPKNEMLPDRREQVQSLRDRGEPTVPFTIAAERQTNPFVRVAEPAVIEAARRHEPSAAGDPVAVFAALRRWKDRF